MRQGKIEVYKDRKKEWRFRIKAKNGRILAHGEGYKNKLDVHKAIYAIEEVITYVSPTEI